MIAFLIGAFNLSHSPLPSNVHRELNYPGTLLDNTMKIGDQQNRLYVNTQTAPSFLQQSAVLDIGLCAPAGRHRNLPFDSDIISHDMKQPINISSRGPEIEPIIIDNNVRIQRGLQIQPINDNVVSRVYGVQHQSNLNWSAPAYRPQGTCAMSFIPPPVFPSNFSTFSQSNGPCGTHVRADPLNSYACATQDNNLFLRNQKLYPARHAQQTQWQPFIQQPPYVITPFWGDRHPNMPLVQNQFLPNSMQAQQFGAAFVGGVGDPENHGNIEWSNKT